MLFWIIQCFTFSFLIIFVIHQLFEYFKTTWTSPIKHIYTNNSSQVNVPLSNMSETHNGEKDMKQELKDFIRQHNGGEHCKKEINNENNEISYDIGTTNIYSLYE
jgi:hypothetical protein